MHILLTVSTSTALHVFKKIIVEFDFDMFHLQLKISETKKYLHLLN